MKFKLNKLVTTLNQHLKNNKAEINCEFTRINCDFVQLLYQEGFISKIEILDESPRKVRFFLKRNQKNEFILKQVIFIIKKGQRKFMSSSVLWSNLSKKFGFFVLSTPKGLITDQIARRANKGGELLCYIQY